MRRFIQHLLFSILLVHRLIGHALAVEEVPPVPDTEYGRIKLHEPLPDRANVYANWFHDRQNGFRVLIPAMSTIHCPQEPLKEGSSSILLRIKPFGMEVIDIGLIPTSVDGESITPEQILDAISADEKTDLFNKTSIAKTQWTGQCFRSIGDNAPAPLTTMIARKSVDHFLFASFRSPTQLEFRTALTIIDSISLVDPDFQLEKVLTMHEGGEPKTETVPATTVRGWFEDGRPHGLVTHEDAQGRRVHTLTWLNGQQTGLEFRHWPSGSVYRLRLFEYGVPQVQSLSFYESGELHSVSHVQNGVLKGNCKTYYRDGSLADTVNFKDSHCDGTMLHYLPDGRLAGRTYWEQGKCVGEEPLIQLSQSEIKDSIESVLHPGSVWHMTR